MECTNCGHCCTPCLQMTQKEIDTIKKYIKKFNIRELIYEKDGRLEYVCPFRDRDNQECTIYDVRPEVCQRFECWTEGYNLEGHIQRIVDTSVSTCGVHELFFGNKEFKTRYEVENKEE